MVASSAQQSRLRAAGQMKNNTLNQRSSTPVDTRGQMGRTPSPNFLKRIAGIIHIGEAAGSLNASSKKRKGTDLMLQNLYAASGST